VSGIFSAMSGQPLDVTMSSSAALRAPGNTNRPDMNGAFKVINTYTPGAAYRQWFDTSVFSAPAANTWGNMTRNMGGDIRGPGFMNFDFSLVKQFGFGGSRMGEFRMDIWNLTNRINLNNPNTSFGSSTFGQISGASGERSMRFSVRFLF
jgi:hypothetical protein